MCQWHAVNTTTLAKTAATKTDWATVYRLSHSTYCWSFHPQYFHRLDDLTNSVKAVKDGWKADSCWDKTSTTHDRGEYAIWKKTLYQLQVNLTHSEINLSTVSEPSDMKPKLTKLTISVRLWAAQITTITECYTIVLHRAVLAIFPLTVTMCYHASYNVWEPESIIKSLITFTQWHKGFYGLQAHCQKWL